MIAALAACASPALARQAAGVRRIGYLALHPESSPVATSLQALFRAAMRRHGWAEGTNLAVEWRFAGARVERLAPLAASLVESRVELVVAVFQQAIVAARAASDTLPVVAVGAISPVDLGLVRSLARPGGNLTGTVYFSPHVVGKLFEVLREALPKARRLALLRNPDVPGGDVYAAAYLAGAARMNFTVDMLDARRPEHIDAVLRHLRASRPDALFISGDSVINPAIRSIADFAREARLPTFGTALVHAREGALLYYGPNLEEMIDRVGSFATRILRGASAADLPMEEPARYELVINSRTATLLGWQVPAGLQARVDRFVE